MAARTDRLREGGETVRDLHRPSPPDAHSGPWVKTRSGLKNAETIVLSDLHYPSRVAPPPTPLSDERGAKWRIDNPLGSWFSKILQALFGAAPGSSSVLRGSLKTTTKTRRPLKSEAND